MSLIRANPSRTADLQELRSRMNHLLSDENEGDQLWTPVVDVTETDDEIILEAELPGMKKDEIDIQVNGDTLTLRGERKIERIEKNERYHRIERQYGAWQRSFQIEIPIETSKISADYSAGVLSVRLPKAENVKPRQIAITTG